MRSDPFDHEALRQQIRWQKDHAWDVEKDVPWRLSVQEDGYFLPLDEDSVAFPGLSEEQRVTLSQFLGLVVNATIAQMEGVITKLKDVAWRRRLDAFPVNPELYELGELFFEEEMRHARMFGRYNEVFCAGTGVPPELLERLLPQSFGSVFQRATIANAQAGGNAFWWTVASAEEVSIEIYRAMHKWKDRMDPLYHVVHKKHLEDESRHRNYAFLMLELVHRSSKTPMSYFHRKTDLLFSQCFTTAWVLGQLSRVFEAEKYRKDHPFFERLATCIPHLRRVSPFSLMKRLFVTAPYVSLVLNTKSHRQMVEAARKEGAFQFPFPNPKPNPVFVTDDKDKKKQAS